MANLPQHINSPGPIDLDTDISRISRERLHSAENVELWTDERGGDLRNMRGTTQKVRLTTAGSHICAVLPCWGYTTEKVKGLLYFINSDQDYIKFYSVPENTVTTLFQGDLGWDSTTLVDATSVAETEQDFYVYFTDGINPLRKIKINTTLQAVDDMYVQPLNPIDAIKYQSTLEGGALLSGSYQAAYRYYDSTSCTYSNWSNITPAIPVKPNEWGGRIGQPTNKKVRFQISTSLGVRNFDQIQLLIIENVAGEKENPTKGNLLAPVDIGSTLEYTGNEMLSEIDLSDAVIDKLGLLKPKTLAQSEGHLFVGNFDVNSFQAEPTIERAYTIEREVDYSQPRDAALYKSAYRGEQYAYGIKYSGQFGNSIVKPLDLSAFSSGEVRELSVANLTSVVSISGDIITINVDDSSPLSVGDYIRRGQARLYVVEIISSTQIKIQGALATLAPGTIDLLYGPTGNQSDNWAWKYPDRAQKTIFNEDGNIEALGIKLENISNHPEWATNMEVVRLQRKRDILYQFPHVPTIAVQGKWFEVEDLFTAYDGNEDFLSPKIHNLGVARNLVSLDNPDTYNTDSEGPIEWRIQNSIIGLNETPPVIFAQPPEYMNGVDEPFRVSSAPGRLVEVVDAVLLKADKKVYENRTSTVTTDAGAYREDFPLPFQQAWVFSAKERKRYFYNREWYILNNGAKEYRPRLSDYVNSLNNTFTIDYDIDIPYNSGPVTLPGPVFDSKYLERVNKYANINAVLPSQLRWAADRFISEFFVPHTVYQKGILLKLSNKLKDFTYEFGELCLWGNYDFFPLFDWFMSIETITDDALDQPWHDGEVYNMRSHPAIADGHDAPAAYILNVKTNIGDDRYGSIDNVSGNWVSTGATAELTSTTQEVTLEVFGGDCFITPHAVKVNDGMPIIAANDDRETAAYASLGNAKETVEILEVYLESEVNSYFAYMGDRYPARESDTLSPYTAKYDYYYSPNYSKENTDKPLATEPLLCEQATKLRYTVAWSDKKVRGASPNPFNNVEGYNIFRANNFWTLEGQYGDISKLISLGDKALHILQEDKVAFQPVGIDELQTADGVLIATGTGNVLGSGEYYLQAEAGTQHMQSVVEYNGSVFAVDNNRKKVVQFGSRGSGYKEISFDGYNSFFRNTLRQINTEPSIRAHIDERNNRYIIQLLARDRGYNNPVFNFAAGGWESNFKLDSQLLSGASQTGRVFWVTTDGFIYEAYEGTRLEVFESNLTSEFSFVVNSYPNVTKLFQAIKVNSRNRLSQIRCQVFDETAQAPNQDTGWISINQAPRNHQYYFNRLRSDETRNPKLRGQFMVVSLRITGTQETVLSSIITSMRKSF